MTYHRFIHFFSMMNFVIITVRLRPAKILKTCIRNVVIRIVFFPVAVYLCRCCLCYKYQ